MNTAIIPEVLNNFNVYKSGKKLIGQAGDVELPELSAMTETLNNAGILGEVSDPVTGQFESMTIKIPFAVLYDSVYSLADTTNPTDLTLRGSMQCMDPTTGKTDYYPLRVIVRGKCTKVENGKASKGKKMEPAVELEIHYYKVEINGKNVLTLDKLNGVYILNGKDMMAKIRAQI